MTAFDYIVKYHCFYPGLKKLPWSGWMTKKGIEDLYKKIQSLLDVTLGEESTEEALLYSNCTESEKPT